MKNILWLILPCLFACSGPPKENETEIRSNDIQIAITELQSPTHASLRGIWVVDSNCIWVSGSEGTILRTIDGGMRWSMIPAPDSVDYDFRDVHAFSKDEALIMTAGFPAKLYLTEDGGNSWQVVLEESDSAAFFDGIHFKDADHGLLLGDRLNGYHYLMTTSDKGRSWLRVAQDKLPSPLKVEHAYAASGSSICLNTANDYVIALGGEQNRIFYQTKGNAWKAVNSPYQDTSASSGFYSIASGNGKLIAVGGDFRKAKVKTNAYLSENGGKDWEKAGDLRGYRSVIDHHSGLDIWLAAGINGMEYSKDGGKNWDLVATANFNTLQFDDSSMHGWAAGPNGSLYRIDLRK